MRTLKKAILKVASTFQSVHICINEGGNTMTLVTFLKHFSMVFNIYHSLSLLVLLMMSLKELNSKCPAHRMSVVKWAG